MTISLTSEYKPIRLPDYVELPVDEMRHRANAFYNVMRKRHTVRDFSSNPVPRDIIEQCLLTAGTAPSGANHQPWHFSAIGDPKMKKHIRDAAEKEEKAFYSGRAGQEWLDALKPLGTDANKAFLETAPWLICIFGSRKSPTPRHYAEKLLCARVCFYRDRFLDSRTTPSGPCDAHPYPQSNELSK